MKKLDIKSPLVHRDNSPGPNSKKVKVRVDNRRGAKSTTTITVTENEKGGRG